MTGTTRNDDENQRDWLHRYERHIARQPGTGPGRPDPIHVARVRLHDKPGADMYLLARWSLLARLRRDAEGSGDTLDDLGPRALKICQAAQNGDWAIGELAQVGIAADGRWLTWLPPAPVEPVPGSPGERAASN